VVIAGASAARAEKKVRLADHGLLLRLPRSDQVADEYLFAL
jgi:hypothetical protein